MLFFYVVTSAFIVSDSTSIPVCVTSGFHREVDENCALLGSYVERRGNSLPKFRVNISVPSSGVKNPKR
jgi:hypothetical protein